MNKIIVASKNQGKVNEYKQFFSQFNIQCLSLLDLDKTYKDVEETGMTFTENAIIKAEAAANYFQETVIADDSGLVIDALHGKPGVQTARYAGAHKNDEDNMQKVLHQLKHVKTRDRTARFVAVLAIASPNNQTITQKGICEGKIADKQAGTNGFGYDPIFIPDGYTKTMAQLTSDEKNKISHRSQAFKQLKNHLLSTTHK